jgi:hypothetical protein
VRFPLEGTAAPFPDPLSPVLDLVIRSAVDALRRGDAEAEDAIRQAAATAWYEGHIEGEDACAGCHYRGDDPVYAGQLRRYRG